MLIRRQLITELRRELESLLRSDPSLYRALFIDGRPVPSNLLPQALPALLEQLEILTIEGSQTPTIVRSAIRVFPIADCWVATDHVWYKGDEIESGTVMPMCPENELLLRELAVEREQSVLDVGVGSGVLGIAAKLRGAGRITGLEINPRAELFLQFNIALNNLCEHDFSFHMNESRRIEDVFAPVQGQSYQVIVANPPFEYGRSLCPNSLMCAAAGVDGLDMIRFLLFHVPEYLVDGGRFFMVFFSPGTAEGPTELLKSAAQLPGRTRVKHTTNPLPTKDFAKESLGLELTDIPSHQTFMWFGVLNFKKTRVDCALEVKCIPAVPGWNLALHSPVNVAFRAPEVDVVFVG